MSDQLEAQAREQFEQLRAERKALAEERRAADEAAQRRKQELERQAQMLLARLDAVEERERALGERGSASTDELQAVQQQVYDLQTRLELLQAERDAAWAQVHAAKETAEQQRHVLQTELETAQRSIHDLRREGDELRERLALADRQRQELQTALQEVTSGGTDADRVELGGSHARLLREYGLEHTDLRLGELADLGQNAVTAGREMSPETECTALRQQLNELRAHADRQQAALEEMQATLEREPSAGVQHQVQELRANLEAALQHIENLQADGDSLRERLANAERQRHDLETALNEATGGDADRVQLGGGNTYLLREYGLEHTDLRLGELAGLGRHAVPAELEMTSAETECVSLRQQLAELRAQAEAQQAELHEMCAALDNQRNRATAAGDAPPSEDVEAWRRWRDQQEADLHLQEVELREMRAIIEQELAQERAQLAEERLRIARMRVALRLQSQEQTALETEVKRGNPE